MSWLSKALKSVERSVRRTIKKPFDPKSIAHMVFAGDPIAYNLDTKVRDFAKGRVTPKMPDIDIKIPDPVAPAPPAPVAEREAPIPEFGGDSSENARKAKRRGRRALRIDLNLGYVGSGGVGLNVPQG